MSTIIVEEGLLAGGPVEWNPDPAWGQPRPESPWERLRERLGWAGMRVLEVRATAGASRGAPGEEADNTPRGVAEWRQCRPEDLGGQEAESFDRVVWEGVHPAGMSPGLALELVGAVLRPGGLAWLKFGPLWSGPRGHGLEGGDGGESIPPWGHLLMTPPVMESFLRGVTEVSAAGVMAWQIYGRGDRLRLFADDCRLYLESASLELVECVDLDRVEVPARLEAALRERYPDRKDFATGAIEAILRRPATGAEGLEPTWLCMLAHRSHYRKEMLHAGEVFCGPDCEETEGTEGNPCVKSPAGNYALPALVAKLPARFRPKAIVVKADSTRRNQPAGLGEFKVPRLLVCGNTQVMDNPIQSMLVYATSQPFDYLASDNNRQHLHFYSYLLETSRIFWLPTMNINPRVLEPVARPERHICFIGQTGKFHPYRTWLLQRLVEDRLPLFAGTMPQEEAARAYQRAQITLNVSLNGDLNLRILEVLAAGGCLVTDRLSVQSGLFHLFEENRHFVAYGDYEELREKVTHLLEHPEETRRIAAAGHAAYLEAHQPEHKRALVRQLLATGDLPDFYRVTAEPRSLHNAPASLEELEGRVALYEYVQELHRQTAGLSLTAMPDVNAGTLCDLADLPRLQLRVEARPEEAPQGLAERLRLCRVSDRVEWKHGPEDPGPDLLLAGADSLEEGLKAHPAAGRILLWGEDTARAAGKRLAEERGFRTAGACPHFSVWSR